MANGSHRTPGFSSTCSFPMPTASHEGTPETFPFFPLSTFPLLCLPLSFCPNRSDSGADSLVQQILNKLLYTSHLVGHLFPHTRKKEIKTKQGSATADRLRSTILGSAITSRVGLGRASRALAARDSGSKVVARFSRPGMSRGSRETGAGNGQGAWDARLTCIPLLHVSGLESLQPHGVGGGASAQALGARALSAPPRGAELTSRPADAAAAGYYLLGAGVQPSPSARRALGGRQVSAPGQVSAASLEQLVRTRVWFPLLEVKHNRESGTWGLGSGCVYFSHQVGAAGQQGNLLYFLPEDAFAVALQSEDGVLRWQPPNRLAAV